MKRLTALLIGLIVAAACTQPAPSPCEEVLPSGCIHVTKAGDPPPTGWEYWIEDDGDPIGYWANTRPPFEATRLAWSKGPQGDIYNTFVCAFSDGTDA